MKKINPLALMILIVFSVTPAWAQYSMSGEKQEESSGLEPGLETVKMGDLNIVVPKGSKIHKVGAQLFVEDIGGFVGRKVDLLEKQVSELNAKQGKLEQEIANLKTNIDELNKAKLDTQEKKPTPPQPPSKEQ